MEPGPQMARLHSHGGTEHPERGGRSFERLRTERFSGWKEMTMLRARRPRLIASMLGTAFVGASSASTPGPGAELRHRTRSEPRGWWSGRLRSRFTCASSWEVLESILTVLKTFLKVSDRPSGGPAVEGRGMPEKLSSGDVKSGTENVRPRRVLSSHWMRQGVLVGTAVMAVLLGVLVVGAPTAGAVEAHLFEPVLSLTGGAGTSAVDPVPDPGPNHPPSAFSDACGVAIDRFGDIYVASAAKGASFDGTEGRIDVFSPEGRFLTEIKDENQPCGLAVDSAGNLYVHDEGVEGSVEDGGVVLYEPSAFPPVLGTSYGDPTIVVPPSGSGGKAQFGSGIAVDPSNDHLYVSYGDRVAEFTSAAEGLGLIDESLALGISGDIKGLDVYGANHDLYIAGDVVSPSYQPLEGRVYVLDGSDGHLKLTIDGSDGDALTTDRTPQNGFNFAFAKAGIAVDQANGDVYVGDTEVRGIVDQFGAD